MYKLNWITNTLTKTYAQSFCLLLRHNTKGKIEKKIIKLVGEFLREAGDRAIDTRDLSSQIPEITKSRTRADTVFEELEAQLDISSYNRERS